MLHDKETGCRKAGPVQHMSAEGKVRAAIGGTPGSQHSTGSALWITTLFWAEALCSSWARLRLPTETGVQTTSW